MILESIGGQGKKGGEDGNIKSRMKENEKIFFR